MAMLLGLKSTISVSNSAVLSGVLVRGVEISDNAALLDLLHEAEGDLSVFLESRLARGTRIAE